MQSRARSEAVSPARAADTARLSRPAPTRPADSGRPLRHALLAATAAAQAVTGTILGTVKDATGGVVPGTVVTLTQSSTGLTRSVATDGNGEYAAPLLATGVYTLRLERSGYKTASVTGVELGVDRKVRVDLTLEIGNLTDAITVQADNPLVQRSTSDLSVTLVAAQLQALPLNGRNFVQLARTTPGTFEECPARTSTAPARCVASLGVILGQRPAQSGQHVSARRPRQQRGLAQLRSRSSRMSTRSTR